MSASWVVVLLAHQILRKMIVISPVVRDEKGVFPRDTPSFIAEKFAHALQQTRGCQFQYDIVNDIAVLG